MILKVRVSYLFIMFLFKMTKSKSSKTKQKTATLIFEGRKKCCQPGKLPSRYARLGKNQMWDTRCIFTFYVCTIYF